MGHRDGPRADQKSIRSGTSVWKAIGAAPIAFAPLRDRMTCEIAIVGGGITGGLIGHSLARAGFDVVLVDKGDVGAGSTAASTGLLQYEIDTPLLDLISKVGETHAVRAYRRGQWAIDALDQLTQGLKIDCGFTRRSTLCLASSEADAVELRREHECRRHFGFDVHWISRAELREVWRLDSPGALHSTGDGQVDPYRLAQGLLAAAVSDGLRAFSSSEVLDASELASSVTLQTQAGEIVADKVVFCTGYFPLPWVPKGTTTLNSTYAACSQPIPPVPGWSDGCLIWETARPYFYARQTPEGRAIIGGEDTSFSRDHFSDELLTLKGELLANRFEELFPGTSFPIEFLWAGTFAETRDGLPYIGVLPGHERLYAALGYGGNGITFSTIAARLIADLLSGRVNEDMAIFSFDR